MATASFPTSVKSFGQMESTHQKLDQITAEIEAMQTAMKGRIATLAAAGGAQAFDTTLYDAVVADQALTASCTITLNMAAGEVVDVIMTGHQNKAVHLTDDVGAIDFTASKKGSVRILHNGHAIMRVGTHYQES